MSEQAAIVKSHNDLVLFGSRNEVRELAQRIQMMLPGGQRYTEKEALTLAQISVAHDLDPFNGECWLIKDEQTGKVYGALIGIKGHRKHAKRQANYWGQGPNGGFERITDPKKLEEYGADPGDICYEYRIADESSLEAYANSLGLFIKLGFPLDTAQKMAGPAPVTLGVGVYKRGEKTKMKPAQCAMFRAEKDALKRRFDVKFRIEIGGKPMLMSSAEDDEELDAAALEGEYTELEGSESEEPRDQEEVMAELGFDPGVRGESDPQVEGARQPVPQSPAPQQPKPNGKRSWPAWAIDAVVNASYAENPPNAVGMLNKSNLDPKAAEVEDVVNWARAYRAWRDLEKTPDEAAALANEGKAPA